MFEESDVVFSYTRAQAIEDGVLVDVSEMGKECGFKYPVAVTRAVWNEVIVPSDKAKSCGQSESGRAWDLLWMLLVTIKRSKGQQDLIFYEMIVSDGKQQSTVKLKAVCGPGDDMKPVITVMLPTED